MIKSFDHKGLEKFFLSGIISGIQPKHAKKLSMMLDALDRAIEVKALNIPGWNLHKLSGDLQNFWSLKVNANWRLTFIFENGNVYVVDYKDYH